MQTRALPKLYKMQTNLVYQSCRQSVSTLDKVCLSWNWCCDQDASYGTTVSKMCYVRARCFFIVGRGRSGAAEQQGAPSPFPWGPWECSDQWVTAADVVNFVKVPAVVQGEAGMRLDPRRTGRSTRAHEHEHKMAWARARDGTSMTRRS